MNVAGAESPTGACTITSTGPSAWAGLATVIVVSFTTLNPTPGVPPKVTPVAPVNPLPVMVTGVPPVTGPLVGAREVMAGRAMNVNVPGPEVPLGLCTTTSVAPGACAGVTTVMVVSFTTAKPLPAVPPNVTPVAPVNPVPVIVTVVSPVSGPLVGVSDRIAGAARKVKAPGCESPFGCCTTTSTVAGTWAGLVTVMVVSFTTVKAVPAVPPKVAPVAPVNPVPVIVTAVPPAAGPLVGVREVMAGTCRNVKSPGCESPLGCCTITSTAPGACAGVVTVMVVSFTTVKAVPAVPPKVAPVAPVNPVPVIVTAVPPAAGPLVGVREVMAGTCRNVKSPGCESPLGCCTITSTAPGACAGVVTVMVVSFTTVKAVPASPPKVTPVAPVKFVPVTVTSVPPVSGPLVGATELMVGIGSNVKAPGADSPLGLCTITSDGPAACAGVVTVMVFGSTTVKAVPAMPSNVTPVAPVKPLPVMVTAVPPVSGP